MKVKDYDSDYPENFNWSTLESISLSSLGEWIAREIKFELAHTPAEFRVLTPGLRSVLREIARRGGM